MIVCFFYPDFNALTKEQIENLNFFPPLDPPLGPSKELGFKVIINNIQKHIKVHVKVKQKAKFYQIIRAPKKIFIKVRKLDKF
jgi:hypothetical protein